MDPGITPLFLFSFFSYFATAFAGFGGMILPLALGAHFYSIPWMLPVLVPLTLVSNSYILIRYHRYVQIELLLKKIFPLMGIGLVIGIFLFDLVQGELLKTVFGVLVILLALRDLYQLYTASQERAPLSPGACRTYIFFAGVIQGLYACGGPLLVYVLNRLGLSKMVFRSTLSLVWVTMNTVLSIIYFSTGKADLTSLRYSLLLIPALACGLLAGDLLHGKIAERPFKTVVFVFLVAAGASIIF
ncbi:MAG: sulfite exporter TauE/SafE family protein [Desulfohalobiaceae bacterium]|nr:sulfite exporter TauE/SafE family protein [Desulfohalobiaceae bacterium]